jgi:transcriptional regulator with XRE-family HTH domain
MTLDEFIALRKQLGLTQTELGVFFGLKLRTVQDIESGKSPLRPAYALAAERVALALAIERKEPMLAPLSVRREALELARLIAG